VRQGRTSPSRAGRVVARVHTDFGGIVVHGRGLLLLLLKVMAARHGMAPLLSRLVLEAA